MAPARSFAPAAWASFDPLGDPGPRVLVDHGPDVGRLVRRVADDERLDLREEALEEAVENRSLDVDPLDGDAALAGEGEGVRGELGGGEVEVGVGGHDDGRRVAELQSHALLRRALGDAPADAARAGERDHPDALVLDEHVADLGGRSDEDGQPAGRESGFLLELGEEQRRERRRARGLEHDRAAGGERGGELVRDEVAREVEGRDRADDADRPAQRERDLALAGLRRVHRDDVAGELARFDRGERVGRDGPRRLDARGLDRLAGLGADRLGHVLVPLAQQARDAVEDRRALVCRQRALESACGGVDCPPRVVGAGLRRAADDLAGVRASEPRSSSVVVAICSARAQA